MPILSISVFATFVAVTSAVAPKSVNLVIETRIRIEPQENTRKVLNDINTFLNKLKHALKPIVKDQISRRIGETEKKYFTNFLKDVLKVILNLKYNEIEWFFKRLYEEIKYYFSYKGSAFANIVNNSIVEKYLVETLKEWSETDPFIIKRSIRNYMKIAVNKNNTLNRLADLLNNFYEQKDENKIKKYVDKLKNCTEEKDFAKVITSALHTLIIKHYDNMNYTIRIKISEEINRLAEYAIQRRFKGDKDIKPTSNIITNINDSTKTTSSVGNISKMVNDNKNNILTKNDTDAIKKEENVFEQKDPIENMIPVEKDIDKIKQKYSKTSGDKHDAQANTWVETVTKIHDNIEAVNKNVLRQDISSNNPTKRRLKKLTKSTTQQHVITSPKVLKRFKLKPRPKENINGSATNTSIPQDTNSTNSTPVPHDINNGTTEKNSVPQDIAIQNSNSTIPPSQTTNITTKVTSVPLDIKNGTLTSTYVSLNNEAITVPILRVNKINESTTKSTVETTKHETNVPRNNSIPSLITIPVTTNIASSTIPLRIFGDEMQKHAQRTGRVPKFGPQNIRGSKRHRDRVVPDNTRTIHWLFKRTTRYLSRQAKFELEGFSRNGKNKNHIMDIEQRIDAMDIDGK